MELKDSQSWKNMETALNAEALAYVTYTFFGQQARKDGYVQISDIFNETAGMNWLMRSCCSSACMMARYRTCSTD